MEPQATIIKLPLLESNIGPLNFYRLAADFLKAAHHFPRAQGYSAVPYFQVCRSLELSLKAFCHAKGVTRTRLKYDIGHSLARALQEANMKRLGDIEGLSDAELGELAKADQFYSKKGFEYPERPMFVQMVKGYKGLPDLPTLMGLADRLARKVRSVCEDAAQPGASATP